MRFAGWILDSFRFSQFKKLANNWVLTLLLACSTVYFLLLPGTRKKEAIMSPNETRSANEQEISIQECGCTREIIIQDKEISNKEPYDKVLDRCPSQSSSLRGFHQKVISFSAYDNPSYLQRLPTVAKMCEKFYPAAEGWVIRVYHDFEATDPNFRSVMCKASCEFANIDFCYVKSLQAPLDSYASPSVHPMIWRFLPMADPRTDIFLSRDLDSDITQRELDAVNDWLSSGKILHSMRDNPNHGATILGGMWGTSKLSQLAKNVNWEEIESKMLKQIGANPVIRSMKGLDQVIIGSVVYPAVCKTPELAKSFCKIHDSYFCKTFGDSDPWPSQRNLTVGNNFVGANGHGPMKIPCPVECRPKDHQDWEFC